MTDIFSREKRSEIMSKIKSKDTKPEMIIRKSLHGMGYRYRLHVKELPGKPDIFLPKYNTVIEIMGCFWHGHNCHLGRLPKSNIEFWSNKISSNKERDKLNKGLILEKGLDLLVVWECSIMGKSSWELEGLLEEIESFILNSRNYQEIQGVT